MGIMGSGDKMKNKKWTGLSVILLALFLFSPISVKAEEIDMSGVTGLNGETQTEVQKPTITNTENSNTPDYKEWEQQLPEVTVEEMNDKISGKLWELVKLARDNLTPVFVLLFMVSAGLTISGAMSKKGSMMYGIWGMVVIVLMFTAVNYAEYIMYFVQNWLVN